MKIVPRSRFSWQGPPHLSRGSIPIRASSRICSLDCSFLIFHAVGTSEPTKSSPFHDGFLMVIFIPWDSNILKDHLKNKSKAVSVGEFWKKNIGNPEFPQKKSHLTVFLLRGLVKTKTTNQPTNPPNPPRFFEGISGVAFQRRFFF